MHRAGSTIVLMSLVLTAWIPVGGATVIEGNDVVIEYKPESLTLVSGEWGTVHIDVENTGDEVIYFEIRGNGVETSGGAWVEEEPDKFMVEPNGTFSARVRILSRARPFQADDISDVKISIKYGLNVTSNDDGTWDLERPYLRETIEYSVADGFSPVDGNGPYYIVIIIVMAIAIVLVFALLRSRRKRDGTDGGDMHGPSP